MNYKVAFKRINPIYHKQKELLFGMKTPLSMSTVLRSDWAFPNVMSNEPWRNKADVCSHVSTFLVYGDKRQKDNLLMRVCSRVALLPCQASDNRPLVWLVTAQYHLFISLTAARFNKHGLHHQPGAEWKIWSCQHCESSLDTMAISV